MIRPISVSALPNYRIRVAFSDGTEGTVDLSDLAGQGVFKAWKDERFFAGVHLGPGRQIRWSEEIELCPDAVYLRLTGKAPDRNLVADAVGTCCHAGVLRPVMDKVGID